MRLSAHVNQHGIDPFRFDDFVFVGRLAANAPNPLVVVGGQALETWGHFFGVPSPLGNANPLTEDTDFLGSRQDAIWLCLRLGKDATEIHFPSADDTGPSTALAYLRRSDGRVLMMDFLRTIVGPSNADVQKWAVPLRVADAVDIRILHPLLCLESRMANLECIPGKRNGNGPIQAQWSVSIVAAYLEHMPFASTDDADELAKACRKVAEMAEFKSGRFCWLNYKLDPLAAISPSVVQRCGAGFANQEWPRVVDRIRAKRIGWEKFQQRQ